MSKQKEIGLCTYCQNEVEVTVDHIIPRGLFNGAVPQDVPKAPACHTCNNDKKSKDDSLLRDLLVLDDASSQHPIAQAIFAGRFTRAVKGGKSEGVRQALRATPVAITTPGGLIRDMGYVFPPATQARTDMILARIVRGLYRCYTSDLLPLEATFAVTRLRKKPEHIRAVQSFVSLGATRIQAGDGQVFSVLLSPPRRPDPKLVDT